MPSVMAAAMKMNEASSSLSPFTPLKRGLNRIHISRGMLKIRVSVMELGRFTIGEAPGAGRLPVLIMLHGEVERNARSAAMGKLIAREKNKPRGTRGSQKFSPCVPL